MIHGEVVEDVDVNNSDYIILDSEFFEESFIVSPINDELLVLRLLGFYEGDTSWQEPGFKFGFENLSHLWDVVFTKGDNELRIGPFTHYDKVILEKGSKVYSLPPQIISEDFK